MKIGLPKEIKNNEFRVGLTDSEVFNLTQKSHKVYVQKGAGLGCQISDEAFKKAGAVLCEKASEVYENSDLIVKVKEPLKEEYRLLKEKQILYTFLHLAAESELTEVLMEKKITSIAYETIEDHKGNLPLLVPMSEVAGKMATQIGSFYLQSNQQGKGLLMGGVTGTKKAKVCVLGAGVVGLNASKIALGLGADVCILDINLDRLRYLDDVFQGKLQTLYASNKNIKESVLEADLLIGAVLLPGRKAPKLVSKDLVEKMKPKSVIVDVSVDQGGCIETCKVTSHKNPIFYHKGILHYCVPNIPGVVPITSTHALLSKSFPYLSQIVEKGVEKAIHEDRALLKGLNTFKGYVTYPAVAEDLNLNYKEYSQII